MKQNRNVLFVEGVDDLNVIAHLLKHHLRIEDVKTIVYIKNQKGIDQLLEGIPVEIKNNSELQRFGIVVDADENIDARWQAVCYRLKILNIEVPNTPESDGTILKFKRADDQEIKIGIWIMPDNKVPGTLENFVTFMIPEKDMLWNRATNCVAQIPKEEFSFDIENKSLFSWQSKAEIHTWLAWQKEPGKPYGTAIYETFLDPKAPYTHNFLNWLKRLFELNEKPDSL